MTKLISSIKKPLALLASVLLLACMPAAAYAVPAVDVTAQCALTVRCAYASALLGGVSVRVYRAADADANMRFTLAPAFADSGVDLAAMTGAAQWSSAAAALAKYAQETKLTPEYSGKTDASGALALSALTPGLYLVVTDAYTDNGGVYSAAPSLVALPGLNAAGDAILCATAPVISAQCLRVPVSDGHMAAVSVSFDRTPSPEQILERWTDYHTVAQQLALPSAPAPFLRYMDDPDRPQTRLDRDFEGGMGVTIGRLRRDPVLDYKFVCLSHNTLRGAAGGGVLSAELLCAQGYISRKE